MSSPKREFTLTVHRVEPGQYGLTVTGMPLYRNGIHDISVSIQGRPLHCVMDHVLNALKHSGYSPSDLSPRRKKPFSLSEDEGVRLGLLFLAVKPLHKTGRIEAVSDTLRSMETEETFYWFSKCSTEPDAGRARRAFRLLAAEE